jgi:hypothetical protein
VNARGHGPWFGCGLAALGLWLAMGAPRADAAGEYILIVVVDREADHIVRLDCVQRSLHGIRHRQGHGRSLASGLPAKDAAAGNDVINLGGAEQSGRQVAGCIAGPEGGIVVVGRPAIALAATVCQDRDGVEARIGTYMSPPMVGAVDGVDQHGCHVWLCLTARLTSSR